MSSLKQIRDQISESMLKGKTPPSADAFDEDKYPFGAKPGHDHCMTCGKPPSDSPRGPAFLFRDHLSAKEYKISGMCQTCQDGVFDCD